MTIVPLGVSTVTVAADPAVACGGADAGQADAEPAPDGTAPALPDGADEAACEHAHASVATIASAIARTGVD
jgi:hypothetical protein